jgi:hypothetical protein
LYSKSTYRLHPAFALATFFTGRTPFILQRYSKECFEVDVFGKYTLVIGNLNNYTIQQDSLVKTFHHIKYLFSQNHQQLDLPSSQEASSSMSRNPFCAVPWNAEASKRNPYVDAASNFVQSSFFSVFSPGRFPVLIVLSDSFHKGVLSIVTFELLNMASVEKEELLIMIMLNILSELTKNTMEMNEYLHCRVS